MDSTLVVRYHRPPAEDSPQIAMAGIGRISMSGEPRGIAAAAATKCWFDGAAQALPRACSSVRDQRRRSWPASPA
ncbi:MAG: hypothetical protein U5K43_04075 [Halofilum sp. (in: g-proteobacteria)]|nr:hypothetical protein [Halofilum sp. (in: g-proteobacteria)]